MTSQKSQKGQPKSQLQQANAMKAQYLKKHSEASNLLDVIQNEAVGDWSPYYGSVDHEELKQAKAKLDEISLKDPFVSEFLWKSIVQMKAKYEDEELERKCGSVVLLLAAPVKDVGTALRKLVKMFEARAMIEAEGR